MILEGYCSECHQPCEVMTFDFGIGPYEFWGQTGTDKHLAAVSSCCEAPAFEDQEETRQITLEDLEPDYND